MSFDQPTISKLQSPMKILEFTRTQRPLQATDVFLAFGDFTFFEKEVRDMRIKIHMRQSKAQKFNFQQWFERFDKAIDKYEKIGLEAKNKELRIVILPETWQTKTIIKNNIIVLPEMLYEENSQLQDLLNKTLINYILSQYTFSDPWFCD